MKTPLDFPGRLLSTLTSASSLQVIPRRPTELWKARPPKTRLAVRYRSVVAIVTLLWLAMLGTNTAGAQSVLTSGGNHDGTILLNSTNTYTFTANAGENVVLRIGMLTLTNNFYPWMRVYNPDGVLVGSGVIAGDAVEEIALSTTNSGTFTVSVTDGNYGGSGGTGTYRLHYFKLPGAFAVADEGGAMTNGGNHDATITTGDLDLWGFTATNGDRVVLRVGQVSAGGYFNPWLRVYGPDGALIGSGLVAGDIVQEIALTATNSGTFTVLVADGNYGGSDGTGDYRLHYVKVPGAFVVADDGGVMANGGNHDGTVDIGDLDLWSFTATNGDRLVLRVGQVSAVGYFNPWLRVYGPDGVLIGSGLDSGDLVEEVAVTATNSGTFTVVVGDGSYGGFDGTGNYRLHYVKVPGAFVVADEGGVLTNGGTHNGAIGIGDLDAWSFTAGGGDRVVLRIGQGAAAGFFNPWLRVYGPDGALIGSGVIAGDTTEEIELTTTNSGTFTVLAADGNYGGFDGTGTYILNYIKVPGSFIVSPGDEGGGLTNGTQNAGTIDVGDLDVWSFTATNGDRVVLRMGLVTTVNFFNPWLRVYGPDGRLIGSGAIAGQTDTEIPLTATNSGTFIVVVSDGNYGGYDGTGNYQLNFVKAPGSIAVSSGDEGGIMTNGFTYTGTNLLGDLDAWSFYGTVGDSNIFRIATTNFTPWLRLYGPSGALVAQAFTANGNNRTNYLTYNITNEGAYTLISSAYYLDQSGTYSLKQSRVPPDLNVPDTQIINEGDTLNVSISAHDPDVPDKPLTFTKISAPPGVVLTPNGNTNAAITWPTDETTGPNTNTIVVSVTDNVSGKDFIRTNSFIVMVNELNEPPVLTVPGPQVINELTPLNVSASATDPDFPTNVLKFSLVSPPSGMTIDPDTGAILWTPNETQGPFTNTITVVVTDTNPPAVNATSISITNFFTVIAREVNLAPQLTVPINQTITELTTLSVNASATDGDLPANALAYSLISPPAGMTINTNTGAIAWTPTEGQGSNTYNVTVTVTDTSPQAVNAQQLSDTKFFTVTVTESNSPPRFTSVPGSQIVTELSALNLTVSAADDDLPANTLTYALVSPPAGMNINAGNGAITWTPAEVQGSNFYTITVTVTDTNPAGINQKQFTITTNFTVTVNEANSPPRFTSVPANQIITELTALNVSVTAADDDLPANPLTYALVSPPAGMNINSGSGVITWTPTEAQGSNFYTITVTVADTNIAAINQKQFTITTNFTVMVNEANGPPVLTVPGTQTIDELTLLAVSASATDSDLPANPLAYALVAPPSGMNINPNSGAITWTPTEAQGSNFYTITVTATDTNPAAINQKQFTVTNTFTVTVNESNSPPVLLSLTNQSLHYGLPLVAQAIASDGDLPANTLAFTLDLAPSNMTINAASGVISWTPVLAQFGTNAITVRVTDNGAPPKFATQTFRVAVTGGQSQLSIQPLAGGLKQINILGDTGLNYELQSSTNLVDWAQLLQFNLSVSPYPYIDPAAATTPRRFYRLKLLSQ